jgi:hypothetical protein
VDIVVFSVFQYLTLGPSSPFFMYFMFSMFCGAIRWGPRGTLATGAVVIVTYAFMTVSMSQTLGPAQIRSEPHHHPDRVSRRHARNARLPGPVRGAPAGGDRTGWPAGRWPPAKAAIAALAEILQHACGILGAPRALVAWMSLRNRESRLPPGPTAV